MRETNKQVAAFAELEKGRATSWRDLFSGAAGGEVDMDTTATNTNAPLLTAEQSYSTVQRVSRPLPYSRW